MDDLHSKLSCKLEAFGQQHLLDHWSNLSEGEKQEFASEIESIDFQSIRTLSNEADQRVDWGGLARRAKPPQAIRLQEQSASLSSARQRGSDAIRQGQVAMILVAGGQGTRLGFASPKGMFRIGPVSNRTLFAMHVDSLRGAMKKFEVDIPLLIMTSPATDAETRKYFANHDYLGMDRELVWIFQQGTMPAIDAQNGRVLLESQGHIAMSPDGHGGIVRALKVNGLLDECKRRGIEQFFYAQVDNPLVTACDPALVGYHLESQSQMTTQVVQKRFAKEKVGNVVSIDGRTQIIEYSDLPNDIAEQKNSDGSLALWAGNIAVHVIDRRFLETASQDTSRLPFHRALKTVPFVNRTGETIRPAEPNAIKFERFVFDLLPQAEKAIVVEGDASEVFAPVKNADGALTDTPCHARIAISDRFKRWLVAAGAEISASCLVEINPLWAWDSEDVKSKVKSPVNIQSDTYFA